MKKCRIALAIALCAPMAIISSVCIILIVEEAKENLPGVVVAVICVILYLLAFWLIESGKLASTDDGKQTE